MAPDGFMVQCRVSAVEDIITPFALAAHSEGLSFRGGKLDDTTVVVGLVGDLDTANCNCSEQVEHLHQCRIEYFLRFWYNT